MKKRKSFMNDKSIRDYFIEVCKEENTRFTEKNFSLYLNYCEKDYYQWLKDNFKFFSNELSSKENK